MAKASPKSASKKTPSNQPTQKLRPAGKMAKGSYATLHDRLRGPIREALKEQLKITNIHALPRIEKVILNVGINKSKDSKEIHAYIGECLSTITGLKPIYTKARVAISNFKTREGLVVVAMVTLRGRRMEEFID